MPAKKKKFYVEVYVCEYVNVYVTATSEKAACAEAHRRVAKRKITHKMMDKQTTNAREL